MRLTARRTVRIDFSISTAPVLLRTGAFPNEFLSDTALLCVSGDQPLQFPLEVRRHLRIRSDRKKVVTVGEVQALRRGLVRTGNGRVTIMLAGPAL